MADLLGIALPRLFLGVFYSRLADVWLTGMVPPFLVWLGVVTSLNMVLGLGVCDCILLSDDANCLSFLFPPFNDLL